MYQGVRVLRWGALWLCGPCSSARVILIGTSHIGAMW